MENTYIVNQKTSFVHGGRVYGPNDEINANLFSDTDLKVLIKNEKLITKAQAKSIFADNAETPNPPAPPSGNGQKSLDEMTVEELKAFAAEKNISVSGNKAEILAAIKTAVSPAFRQWLKSLDEMSLDELKEYAKGKNISAKNGPLPWQNMNRDELLAAIKTPVTENKTGNQ